MRYTDSVKNYVGTFLKVIHRLGPIRQDDTIIVLYLRPRKRFLFAGYWPGYERTAAAGKWSKRGQTISLSGQGTLSADFLLTSERRPLSRVFTIVNQAFTPTLTAEQELEGWSLLSWVGPFTYVGESTVIDPDGRWLPDSLVTVDAWIERIAGVA
ncbi:MAG: hypothetical protein JXM73_05805 [Anaerolineae bacterium]|nr:hypothetical protein [Anaerolineae bacterium]